MTRGRRFRTVPGDWTVSDAWSLPTQAHRDERATTPARFAVPDVRALANAGLDAVPGQTTAKTAGSRFRPYARTRGRTRTDHDLALEALVSTSELGRRQAEVVPVEQREICQICVETRSVAEVAAHMRLPLGVVKVMVGDLSDAGLVLIHQPGLVFGDRSSREFMERVLAGLRSL